MSAPRQEREDARVVRSGRWYEATVTFFAASQDEADEVLDRVTFAVCQGHGEGEDHECAMPDWVGSLHLVSRDHQDHRRASQAQPERADSGAAG